MLRAPIYHSLSPYMQSIRETSTHTQNGLHGLHVLAMSPLHQPARTRPATVQLHRTGCDKHRYARPSKGSTRLTARGPHSQRSSRPEAVLRGGARVQPAGSIGVVHVCPLPLPPWQRRCWVASTHPPRGSVRLDLGVSTMQYVCVCVCVFRGPEIKLLMSCVT